MQDPDVVGEHRKNHFFVFVNVRQYHGAPVARRNIWYLTIVFSEHGCRQRTSTWATHYTLWVGYAYIA
jgi:hypothetical protein